jgi:phosphoribosyl-AMP cyclohydrolase
VSAGESTPPWLGEVKWTADGLVPVIVQDHASGRVLMFAWMDRAALEETVAGGYAVFWSRSRRRRWRKGEQSGHVQRVRELRLDCDGDAVLLRVEQEGGIACHTGRQSCFFRRLEDGSWAATDPVLKDPADIYSDSGR